MVAPAAILGMAMKIATLFRNIWRANAVIIFIGGVVAFGFAVVAAAFMFVSKTRERTVYTVVNTDREQQIEQSVGLRSAIRIAGHPWMLVPLESDQRYDQAYSSKNASAARNYAFVSGAVEMRWLYPHSRFLIVDATQLPHAEYSGEPSVTSLVSFKVVQQDTNGDKRLSQDDASSLVFTQPNGTGATTVLENVTRVLSQELMDEQILVIYEDREGYAAATFSLKDFSPVKRERLVLPPAGA